MNDSKDEPVGKGIPQRQELAELYPTPKTYDELRADRQKIQVLRQERVPKYPEIRVVGELGGLVAFLQLIVYAVPSVLLLGNPLMGVSIGFLMGLIWFGLAWAHLHRTADVFGRIELPYALFMVVYVLSVLPVATACYKLIGEDAGVVPVVIFTFVLQACIAGVILGLLKLKSTLATYKIIGLALTVAVCLAGGVLV